jgi:hypothetical protein
MLQLVSLLPQNQIEIDLVNYKDLCNQIKTLEAKKDKLKMKLIESYFHHNDIYKNDDGLVLASYNSSYPIKFQQKLFEEKHPELFEEFCDIREVRTFLVK